jgi:hypothetical protein
VASIIILICWIADVSKALEVCLQDTAQHSTAQRSAAQHSTAQQQPWGLGFMMHGDACVE